MAKKAAKKEDTVTFTNEEVTEYKTGISPLSVDYGREDINDIAKKVNEIIAFITK